MRQQRAELPLGVGLRSAVRIATAAVPPNKPLKLTAAGFGRAIGCARHESW
jgi:hypothetical protein